jgi:hypothetical protein
VPFSLLAGLIAAITAALVAARRAAERRRSLARILEPVDDTVMDKDGAVRSIQAAEATIRTDALARIWNAEHLERLARTYWRFLTRVTLGFIRIHYTEKERTVVFLFKPFRLLRFDPPEYELAADRGVVRWRIRDGLLVARPGEGYLEIEVQDRGPDPDRVGFERLYLEVEVANFYPSLASRLSVPFYKLTQSRIHVLVTYGFLRSLARLDLAVSRVGRFAPHPHRSQNA